MRVHRFEQLVAEVHVGDIEGNVLAGFRRDAVVKFFLGHERQGHALDDDGVSGNGSCDALGFDLLEIEDLGDGIGDLRRIHDGAVNNGVLCQRLHSITNQLIPGLRRLQLHGLNGAGANVQTNELPIFFAPE